MRVQGSPLHQKVFSATGLKATPMDYMEVYNAIKTGVLDGLENEPAGLKSMKFTRSPVLRTDQPPDHDPHPGDQREEVPVLPKDLQDAVLKAAKEAPLITETEVEEGEGLSRRCSRRMA